MCRLVGWVSEQPTTLRELLGDDAVERLLHLSSVHCDGWGVAWTDGDELLVRRSQTQASDDPVFRDVLDSVRTTSALVHLRLGTPGFGHAPSDSHPFCRSGWALAHNGAVGPSDRVDELLPADGGWTPDGTTDSERWFLALRHELDRGADDDPAQHVAAAVGAVIGRAESVGLSCSSWNSLLLGPDALYVVNLHDDAWQPTTIPVWPAEPPAGGAWPPYFDLRWRERPGEFLVVSSGVIDPTPEWSFLPNGSVLRLGHGARDAQVAPIPADRSRVSSRG